MKILMIGTGVIGTLNAIALLALDEMKYNFIEMLEKADELNMQVPNMRILQSFIS